MMTDDAADLPLCPTPLEALLERAALMPERVALIAGGETWSCEQLARESAILARGMLARGVGPGERVAIHMPNISAVVLAYVACWRLGAIAVPLNTRFKAPELAALIDRVQPRLYLGHVDLHGAAIDAGALPAERCYVVGRGDLRSGCEPWAALAEPASEIGDLSDPASTPRDAPAMLLATSGTTGASKLAIWTSEMLAGVASVARARGMGPDDTLPLALPLMHVGGVGACALALLTGAVLVLPRSFEPDVILDAIAEHRCTSFWSMPFVYALLVRAQQARPRDVGSLRLCIVGGDVCPPEVERAFSAEFGLPLLSMWGATEEMWATLPASRPGPLTRLTPGAQLRLTDASGRPVPDVEAGEALIRSPGTTPGYWLGVGRIDYLPDRWFHTGDLMRREPDGHLRYMGRLKDLIVRGGSNVSPVEVEEMLRRQPGVADVAVAGLPDAELGQRVGAALVLTAGTGADAVPSLLAGARRALADYKMPERVAVVDAIPRTALTKVDREAAAAVILDRGMQA